MTRVTLALLALRSFPGDKGQASPGCSTHHLPAGAQYLILPRGQKSPSIRSVRFCEEAAHKIEDPSRPAENAAPTVAGVMLGTKARARCRSSSLRVAIRNPL